MNSLSIRNQKCPNTACRFYDQELRGNIVLHGNSYPRFKCKECNQTWVHNRGQICYGLRQDTEKLLDTLSFLEAGLSIRKIAKFLSVSISTVQRWKRKFNT